MAGGLYACYIGVLTSILRLHEVHRDPGRPGGMGSMLAPSCLLLGVLTVLPAEATRSFDSYRMVIYSLVLILMMIFRPGVTAGQLG